MDIVKKLNAILNKKQKRRVFVLLFMIIIGALLETMSISMILPVVQVVVEPDVFAENELIVEVSSRLHIASADEFMILMIGILIGLFVIKNLYLLFMYYVQYTFVTNNQYKTSGIFLQNYLNRPYEFFLNADTSDMLRTIYSDTGSVFTLILECIQFMTEAVVAVFLCIALLFVDFRMTAVIAGILFGMSALVTAVIKPGLKRVGEESRVRQSKMYKSILQSVTGIKDVKIFAKEDAFLETYKKQGKQYYALTRRYNVFSNIPKLLIETTCIGSILAYLAIMILTGHSVTGMLSQLSAFAFAAARLMPCASRMNTYLANIAYYQPALDYVYEHVEMPKEQYDIRKTERKETRPLAISQPILLEHIDYRYPGTERYIFQDAHMEIPVGKSVGIIGTSGAGKSTIVDVMLGLLKPESGTVCIGGMSVFEQYGGWLANIGYIPQTINLIDDSIRANIAFGIPEDEIDDERVQEVLEEAQLEGFIEQLPEGSQTIVGERGVRLSGGQRQRIGIARALYHNPELLILDEATSALDNDTEAAIMDAINRFHGRKTMLIIAHRMKTIEHCDLIYRVDNGKIVPSALP